jgi:hypothetical protein
LLAAFALAPDAVAQESADDGGRTLTANLESSYDWNAGHWNVPFNLMYSKVTRVGGQMLSFAGGARYYLETPGEGPDWGLRVIVTLLFPE